LKNRDAKHFFKSMPATADNMVQKTYIKNLGASFAPGTLSYMCRTAAADLKGKDI
jgi:hypothetical protein